jgi:hypothetical protein
MTTRDLLQSKREEILRIAERHRHQPGAQAAGAMIILDVGASCAPEQVRESPSERNSRPIPMSPALTILRMSTH